MHAQVAGRFVERMNMAGLGQYDFAHVYITMVDAYSLKN